MVEVLNSYDTLVLEKKWITQDIKVVAFTSFVSKVSALLDKHSSKKHRDNPNGGKSKNKKNNKSKSNKSKRE